MPKYREIRILYDTDPNNFQVPIRFRLYDENEGGFSTPFPPLIQNRQLSVSNPLVLASRTRKNIVPNYRRVRACMNGFIERNVIVPYNTASGLIPDCIRQINSSNNVLNSVYIAEQYLERGIQRWL